MPAKVTQSAKVSKPGTAFRRIAVATTGDIYQGSQIPQWVKKNGGRFLEKVTTEVTHLITTEKAYLENVAEVRAAKALGKIRIVSRDWLICSLYANPVRPVSEAPFLLENLTRPNNKDAEAKGAGGARNKVSPFDQKTTSGGSKRARTQAIQTILLDPSTGAAWDATLLRDGKTPRTREKIRLAIFESSASPKTYSTWARYSRVGKSRVDELTAPKSDIKSAIKNFKDYFKSNTGKSWEERHSEDVPTPRKDDQGNVLPIHDGWYIYDNQENMFTRFLRQPPTSTSATGHASATSHQVSYTEHTNDSTADEEALSTLDAPLEENNAHDRA
ncbi:Uncharacterized protein PECH_001833 [Penicillium ucsense]|uniref:BRCT domain-containing protein n=1 Tax=Penicillium ucsense TaxID=2839758 RepID=A0A8J8VWU5_9EURO|nr:Uncharacterized protein PECM_001569 [Penicillium ucsense]KAF7732254.1 Uncharacterized protein PECH_001833 [Penicillium ucsense]